MRVISSYYSQYIIFLLFCWYFFVLEIFVHGFIHQITHRITNIDLKTSFKLFYNRDKKSRTTSVSSDTSKLIVTENIRSKKSYNNAKTWKPYSNSSSPLSEEEMLIGEGYLQDLLNSNVETIACSKLVKLFASIGDLYHSKNLRIFPNQLVILLQLANKKLPQLNPSELSVIFLALARLKVHYRQIPSLTSPPMSLIYVVDKMNWKEIGDMLWSFATLGVSWVDLSQDLKDCILKSFIKFYSDFDSYYLSSSIWSLAKLGAKWKQINHCHYASIIQQISTLTNQFSPQQASKIVWALGTMGCSTQLIPNDLIDQLLENVNQIKRSQTGNAISAGQTLTGLAKLGLNWDSFSKQSKSIIWEQLVRISMSHNTKALSNSIWAVGSLEAPKSVMPLVVKELVEESIIAVIPDCSSWTICNLLWGLARMGYTWNDFSQIFQDLICDSIMRLADTMNDKDVGILTWSLGELDVPLDTFSLVVLESLYEAIVRTMDNMRAQELARTIWGLSSAGLSWDVLPLGLRWKLNVNLRRVAKEMTRQDIANSAYGFALLAFDSTNPFDPALRGAHETLLSSIETSTRTLNQNTAIISNNKEMEQLRIFAHYLVALDRIIASHQRIPTSLLEVSDMKPNTTSSFLQNNFGLLLINEPVFQNSKLKIKLEFSGFCGCFPIDIGIFLEDNTTLVALIEIDGPHHYRFDGVLRRKDRLKEEMYLRMNRGILFRRIRWDEAKQIGADTLAEELANDILQYSRNIKPWSSSFHKLEREMTKFFSWSLRSSDINPLSNN